MPHNNRIDDIQKRIVKLKKTQAMNSKQTEMKNVPKKIYLQVDADGETPEDFSDLAGVSWCADKINDNDIEYVRASLPSKPVGDVEEMDKVIKCLAMELPEPVWNDVNKKWQEFKATLQQSHAVSGDAAQQSGGLPTLNEPLISQQDLEEYEKMKREEKAQQSGDGWVSVEDAPNAKQYVLCYGSGGRQFAALYDNNTFMAYNPFNDELEECEEVTHWQPLPAPPSTDKQ